MRRWARLSAGVIAGIAWTGLGIHFHMLYAGGASLASALWTLVGFFTVLTNLLVALFFSKLSASPVEHPKLLAGIALSIMLVGVVYALLLSGLVELTAGSAIANVLLHQLTPVLVPLFWLVFAPKGRLTWPDPLLWAAYPLAYLAYALARGAAEGHYAYPFIDVARNGWLAVLLTSFAIAVCFVAAGWVLVRIDRALSVRSS
jgi:hypothetical protein